MFFFLWTLEFLENLERKCLKCYFVVPILDPNVSYAVQCTAARSKLKLIFLVVYFYLEDSSVTLVWPTKKLNNLCVHIFANSRAHELELCSKFKNTWWRYEQILYVIIAMIIIMMSECNCFKISHEKMRNNSVWIFGSAHPAEVRNFSETFC